MVNIPNVPIEKCNFSTRLTNVLRWEGYKTTHDVLRMPLEQLLNKLSEWPNCGKKSSAELKDWVYSVVASNSPEFAKEVDQLTELYELQAKVNNLVNDKKRQLDISLCLFAQSA